ncbi:MAG: hypothetical protein NW201_05480 [Gemmatimonadales bacterium]|nr:hypothetical protein [Gemmatimonadales bacterium]
MTRPLLALLVLFALGACGGERPRGGGAAACGIAAVAGPVTLLSQFSVPNQTLSVPPAKLPPLVTARLAAGPAYRGVVGRTPQGLVIGIEGTLPPRARIQFGVLVLDPAEAVRGVMLFESAPIEGAPQLGTVAIGSAEVPLVGIQLDPKVYEDANCPFFPDSLRR